VHCLAQALLLRSIASKLQGSRTGVKVRFKATKGEGGLLHLVLLSCRFLAGV
jgi:hypothetical protein